MNKNKDTLILSRMRTVICDAVNTQLIKASVLLNICSELSEGRGLSHDTDDSLSV